MYFDAALYSNCDRVLRLYCEDIERNMIPALNRLEKEYSDYGSPILLQFGDSNTLLGNGYLPSHHTNRSNILVHEPRLPVSSKFRFTVLQDDNHSLDEPSTRSCHAGIYPFHPTTFTTYHLSHRTDHLAINVQTTLWDVSLDPIRRYPVGKNTKQDRFSRSNDRYSARQGTTTKERWR